MKPIPFKRRRRYGRSLSPHNIGMVACPHLVARFESNAWWAWRPWLMERGSAGQSRACGAGGL